MILQAHRELLRAPDEEEQDKQGIVFGDKHGPMTTTTTLTTTTTTTSNDNDNAYDYDGHDDV